MINIVRINIFYINNVILSAIIYINNASYLSIKSLYCGCFNDDYTKIMVVNRSKSADGTRGT
jgi:hypothetical protein